MIYNKVANRIQNSLLINNIINKQKPVIFLVSQQEQIKKEHLFGFGHLFMGQKIKCDQENDYPIYKPLEKKGIKEYILNLSICSELVRSIQILEANTGILVTFSFNQWQKINDQNNRDLEEKILQTFVQKSLIIKKIVERIQKFKCPTKYFGIAQYSKKVSREKIKQKLMENLLNYLKIQNNCLLEFNCKKDLSSERKDHIILRVPRDGEITSFPYNQNTLFNDTKYQKIDFSLEFLKEKNMEQDVRTLLINRSIQLQNYTNDFIKIFLQAANVTQPEEENSICEGQDICQILLLKFQLMIQQLNSFILHSKASKLFEREYLEDIEPFYLEVKGKYCQNYSPKENKISKNLCQYFYYLQFREMYKDISKNKQLNIAKEYQKAKEFISHIISLLNELYFDCQNRKEILRCKYYFEEVFQQMKYLINYSNTSSTPLRTIIDFIKKNLKRNQQFSRVVLSIQFTEDQTIDFYESLLELFQTIVIQKDAKKEDQQQLFQKKNYKVMKIQQYETQKLINLYLGKNDKQIALAILRLFDIYERGNFIEEKYKRQFKFNQILLRCGRLLRSIGRSDLAINIYIKLKHFQKVQDCVQEISFNLQKEQKIQLYLKYSEYFRKIGDRSLGWKYLQKSSEEYQCPTQKILRAKYEFLQNNQDQIENEKNLIKKIINGQATIDQYLVGNELDSAFKKDLLNIRYEANQNPEPIRVYFSNGVLTPHLEAIISNI